jgi:hypothetical protein
VLLVDTVTLPKLVAMTMPDEMVMELPEAILLSPPSIVTGPPLVLPSPKARVKILPLLVDDDPETIDASPSAAPNESPPVTLNASLMLVPEPTEIAMLLPELDADKPLLISKAPLLPTLAVPVFNDRSPDMLAAPALLVDTAMLPKLVAMPTPNEMVMEPPKAMLPSLPSIVTAPPLVLPSPKARVKILLLLVDDNPETIGASPLAVCSKLPAITLNDPPMLVSEPTEIALLLPKPDADEQLLISRAPQLPMFAVAAFDNRSPNMPTVPALLIDTATLSKLVAMPTPDEMVMEPPKAILPSPPLIVTAPPLVLPSSKARVKILLLLVDDNLETIHSSSPAAPDKLPAITLNDPPMLMPEPTEIAMLPPEPDADKPLPISKVPLLPMLAVAVFNNRSPKTPAVSALLVDTAMLPKLVAVPTPNEMVMEPPKAVLPSPLLIVTTSPLVLPSPKARVKIPPLLVDVLPLSPLLSLTPPPLPPLSSLLLSLLILLLLLKSSPLLGPSPSLTACH